MLTAKAALMRPVVCKVRQGEGVIYYAGIVPRTTFFIVEFNGREQAAAGYFCEVAIYV